MLTQPSLLAQMRTCYVAETGKLAGMFYDAFRTSDCVASNGGVNGELEGIRKKALVT